MSFEKWKEVKLGDVASYKVEKTNFIFLNSSNYISTDNMLIDRGGIVQSEYVPIKGKVSSYNSSDILVSNIRPYFKKIWLADKDGGCSNDVIVFKSNYNLIDCKYLFYRLSNQDFFDFIMAGSNGTKMPRGNKKSILSFLIKLPPLPTQKKIARILSNYDDLIENNLKQIKLLEEKAKLTYEEWFLRFRIDGQKLEIDENTGLPFGWEKKKIKDFGDVITGKTPATSNQDFYNGDVPFVKTPDMHTFPYVLETNEYLTTLGADSQKNKYLPKNSLMVSCIGTAGVYSLVSFDCQTNQQINSIKFHKEEYVYYMYCFAESLKNILDFIGSNGATMTNVNKTKFENIEVVMPEFDILEKYHNEVKNNFEVILNLLKQNQLLKKSRDILLPRLMSGMIDVEKLDSEV